MGVSDRSGANVTLCLALGIVDALTVALGIVMRFGMRASSAAAPVDNHALARPSGRRLSVPGSLYRGPKPRLAAKKCVREEVTQKEFFVVTRRRTHKHGGSINVCMSDGLYVCSLVILVVLCVCVPLSKICVSLTNMSKQSGPGSELVSACCWQHLFSSCHYYSTFRYGGRAFGTCKCTVNALGADLSGAPPCGRCMHAVQPLSWARPSPGDRIRPPSTPCALQIRLSLPDEHAAVHHEHCRRRRSTAGQSHGASRRCTPGVG